MSDSQSSPPTLSDNDSKIESSRASKGGSEAEDEKSANSAHLSADNGVSSSITVDKVNETKSSNHSDNAISNHDKPPEIKYEIPDVSDTNVPSAPVTIEAVDKVVDQFENLTVFGNKSLNELHSIQSKRSHLSAGIFFTDPSLRMYEIEPLPILDSLTKEMRFEKPSEIQASTLPLILSNKSVIAQAQSGAGKTIAFVIGMLAKVDVNYRGLQALCLAPTRELANQIVDFAVRPLSSRMPAVTYEKAMPGFDIVHGSICSSHIVVGTPGTVKRWAESSYLRMNAVRIFVLDEADKMVEEKSLGKDTLAIKKMLREDTQVLFFSATYAKEILNFARMIVPRAYIVKPKSSEELVLDVIFQVRMNVNNCPGGKLKVLQDIYELLTIQQSIVFVEMKREAERIARMMQDAGFKVSTLHGELQPQDRDRVMEDFRLGRSKVLITTNALARGVDVPAVAVVVNYDLPIKRLGQRTVADAETYLHRIGRCGRFGRKGTAINFLEQQADFAILEEIERVYSPEKRMTSEWDPTDISGLKIAIEDRPEGGEILPTAVSSSAGPSSVSITYMS